MLKFDCSFWGCTIWEDRQRDQQMWGIGRLQFHGLRQGYPRGGEFHVTVFLEQRQQEIWMSDSLGLLDRPSHWALQWNQETPPAHGVLWKSHVIKVIVVMTSNISVHLTESITWNGSIKRLGAILPVDTRSSLFQLIQSAPRGTLTAQLWGFSSPSRLSSRGRNCWSILSPPS